MAETAARRRRLFGWLGWAGLDAFGRLALMTGSTVIFSRMFGPHEFGVTALVLTIVTAASLFVGAPFEEALTQRRHVRKAHFAAALGMSWAVGAVIMAVTLAASGPLATLYGEPDVRTLLPLAMLSIFFSGHSDILTALARRQKRFNDVAYATLVGHVVGIGLSLLLALVGLGLWALVGQRLLVVVARAALLQFRLRHLILPRWQPEHLRQFGRFAGFSFLSRLSENLTYLAFNNVVQALYGVTVLGYVNMAMRLIEPIRGAIIATGHNLAFSYFAPAASQPEALRERAQDTVAQSALVIAPIFVGLAAVTPALLPLVAGAGWDAATGIAVALSLAAALAVPAGLVYTVFSASGRPEFSLVSLLLGFAAMAMTLVLCRQFGPLSVGLSRLAGDGVRMLGALLFAVPALAWPGRDRLRALAPAWLLSSAMGIAVVLLATPLAALPTVAALAIQIMAGVAIYILLLAVFARRFLIEMANRLRRSPRPGGT